MTQHLIILNLNFSALSKVPRSIPFYITEMSQGAVQKKLMRGTNCCHQGKLQATDSEGSRLAPFPGANAIPSSKLNTLKSSNSALDWDLADGVNSPSSCS